MVRTFCLGMGGWQVAGSVELAQEAQTRASNSAAAANYISSFNKYFPVHSSKQANTGTTTPTHMQVFNLIPPFCVQN